jgi:hypothetical protein
VNGLTLLAPAGLFALAALAVPLLIHLFSRSRGKRVLVGNIALYRQAKQQRVTEFHLEQWLLLLLRLLLLALAALLLAGLARKGLETLPGNTAYVTPEWLEQTGDPPTALEPFDAAFLLGSESQSVPGVEAIGPGDAWSQLAERLSGVRHTGEIHVFAQGTAGQFPIRALPFGSDLQWHLTTTPINPDRPSAQRVHLVHAPGRESDAAQLQLALDALATHRDLDLVVERGTTEQPLPRPTPGGPRPLVIWLGNEPASPATVATSGVGAWIEDRESSVNSSPGEAQLPRFPQLLFSTRTAEGTAAVTADERVLWWAQDGHPLLRETRLGETRHLVFEDRLGNDGLTPQAAFPEALLRLLLGEAAWSAGLAHAPADPTPAFREDLADDDGPSRPLAPWLALAIAALFVLERWLSERRSREGGARRSP